jgi:hypothetical protein
MIDYFLKSAVGSVKLEILDAQHQVMRSFSSEDKNPGKHVPLPVAERWLPKPENLEKTPGMHRFVWNLAWVSSGGPIADEEADFHNPSGPKVVPGTYEVRLTVDGQSQTQPLEVRMDPRSPATQEVLSQQFEMGKQMFDETVRARRALAEIGTLKRQLVDAQQHAAQNGLLKSSLTEAQSSLDKLLTNEHPQERGLQDAYKDLASALRVVEGGDRPAPAQAIAVYKESGQQIETRIAELTTFKQTRLKEINQQLRQANLAPIAVTEIEREGEFLMGR